MLTSAGSTTTQITQFSAPQITKFLASHKNLLRLYTNSKDKMNFLQPFCEMVSFITCRPSRQQNQRNQRVDWSPHLLHFRVCLKTLEPASIVLRNDPDPPPK